MGPDKPSNCMNRMFCWQQLRDMMQNVPPNSAHLYPLNTPSQKRAASPNTFPGPSKQARYASQQPLLSNAPQTPQHFYQQYSMPSYPYPYPYPYPYSLPHPSPIPVPLLAASTETPTQPRKRGRPKSKANESAVVATSNPRPRKEWSNEELDKLYDYMLGEAADARFEKLQVTSNKIWKEVAAAKIFDGWTATQLQAKWESSLATFKKLYAFRTFTGCGADADDYDWDVSATR
ncbi:hypothetical protein DFH05DRAFT_1528958 [Lentinula detonsa]|uniref:Uncharacterized protein n=1 Tax=Lentinula detonsa TaxID=2804962 RepID=A0A9W8TUG0_9AGAR|nr:hypothetical protein DFH05DRAFT_1528958 [Lentinula detonsa]